MILLAIEIFYFFSKKIDDNINSSEKTKTIELKNYHNSELGFSIKYPDKIPFYFIIDCISENIEHPELVPIKIFEDNANGVVYFEPEYFYTDNSVWDQGSQSYNYVGECKKITTNLKTIKNGEYYYSERGAIYIKNVKNDNELNKFIKDHYTQMSVKPPGCFFGRKEVWKNQVGVYNVEITGLDDNPDSADFSCWNRTKYFLLYYPEKQKLMTVNFGQEWPFVDKFLGNHDYSEDMINSFKFD